MEINPWEVQTSVDSLINDEEESNFWKKKVVLQYVWSQVQH